MAAFVTLNHIQTINCNGKLAIMLERDTRRKQAIALSLHITASQGCLVDFGK
ncbi:hypothetical protein [Aeromonas cavernicola]|uniref:hypothetical protein n=1 Tax=Aeromonas cavernicola TaxID=1006623 RepID=UPI0012FD5F39|nr:hypothetical protein [Aeromonas cavernicola]